MVVVAPVRWVRGWEFPAAGFYQIDPAHSMIGFDVRHMMLARIHGRFRAFSGTIHVSDTVEQTCIELSIEAGSIDTLHDERDAHLRGGDFFDSDAFPEITYRSRAVQFTGGRMLIEGDLTIRGITQPVQSVAQLTGECADPRGRSRIAAVASAQISLADWDITWNRALTNGGFLVGRDVRISVEIEAVQDEKRHAAI
jgi:polyisoprenoid-binding protein YceI